jgi:hypothetical protein
METESLGSAEVLVMVMVVVHIFKKEKEAG